jgi:hypothetical protein
MKYAKKKICSFDQRIWMKKLIINCLFVICFFSLLGQTLPEERSTDWSKAGLSAAWNEPLLQIDFERAGAYTDGIRANDSLWEFILNTIDDQGAIIYFPSGKYLFHKGIKLKNNMILRGEKPDSTKLIFDLSMEDHAISIQGAETNTEIYLNRDGCRGDSFIIVNDAGTMNAGDCIRIIDEDSLLITSSWARYSTGQIIKIAHIHQDTLFLEDALVRDYSVARNARSIKLDMIHSCAIDKLTMENKKQSQGQTANIFLNYATHCRVSCVKSFDCNFAHVDIRNSSHSEVRDSYFNRALGYGNGGKAYGVMLQQNTSMCLVINNIFDKLRHAMILQSGANANVFAYNYSRDPFWEEVALPSDASGDMVLHGNYPYCNLFEGNVAQNIVIDDSHGENGPWNTFFRNRAAHYGIVMNNDPATDSQNFIGNEIPNTNILLGLYLLFGNDHFAFGNNHKGTIKPNGTAILPESSLFLSRVPEYYSSHSAWPPIGTPHSLNQYSIEAEHRYTLGLLTGCCGEIISSRIPVKKDHTIEIYPNPVNRILKIWDPAGRIVYMELLNSQGLYLQYMDTQKEIDVSMYDQGLYFLRIFGKNGYISFIKFVKI